MHFDCIIIGGGAAGLMAAITAGQRGKRVALIEHTSKIGEKIRISGGGRCNFTNIHASPKNYVSQNPHFAKSALSQYTQFDFIKMVESHNIAYHEKTLGQLFCDGSAKQIINMFLDVCKKHNVDVLTDHTVETIEKPDQFCLSVRHGDIPKTMTSNALIIATGGLSIPKIGASDFGYKIAKQFGLRVLHTQPGLVPLKAAESHKDFCIHLSGVSLPATVHHQSTSFDESILFTHRGLSGPAILQISSYLEKFTNINVHMNLLPHHDLESILRNHTNTKQTVSNVLKNYIPNRLIESLNHLDGLDKPLAELSKKNRKNIVAFFHDHKIPIDGSEGYQKAEVTTGGVDTHHISSKTMMVDTVPGLFFIGEAVDVTGWLGGYNFQWAWSSGFVAGQNC